MKVSFLDYYKLILEKVSFDPQLLGKEYRKALKLLSKQEARQLRQWLDAKGFHIQEVHKHPYHTNREVKLRT